MFGVVGEAFLGCWVEAYPDAVEYVAKSMDGGICRDRNTRVKEAESVHIFRP